MQHLPRDKHRDGSSLRRHGHHLPAVLRALVLAALVGWSIQEASQLPAVTLLPVVIDVRNTSELSKIAPPIHLGLVIPVGPVEGPGVVPGHHPQARDPQVPPPFLVDLCGDMLQAPKNRPHPRWAPRIRLPSRRRRPGVFVPVEGCGRARHVAVLLDVHESHAISTSHFAHRMPAGVQLPLLLQPRHLPLHLGDQVAWQRFPGPNPPV
mmetsp:Transcript_36903/g.96545  ORF Transcript_36903/g.96545 Transcript_36903/m.96545 type:complete len:208 (-) Transcript_36903:200-823(-)